MDKLLEFEKFLFNDEIFYKKFDILDVDFWVNRIVIFPSIRPLLLDKVIGLAAEYCTNLEFRRLFLFKCSNKCPVLIYRLYKMGILSFEEIEPLFSRSEILKYYFRKQIIGFEDQVKTYNIILEYDFSFFEHKNDIDNMIEYGFVPNTVEYCLKYDDIVVFRSIFPLNQCDVQWNPFEWSEKPQLLGLMSVSCFFGALCCFKHMLLNGYHVNDTAKSLAVCSGNLDIFHLFEYGSDHFFMGLYFAAKFFRVSFLDFFLGNGAEIGESSLYEFDSFIIAISYGHLSVVDYHIRKGVDINHLSSEVFPEYSMILLFIKLQNKTIYV